MLLDRKAPRKRKFRIVRGAHSARMTGVYRNNRKQRHCQSHSLARYSFWGRFGERLTFSFASLSNLLVPSF